MLILLPQPLNVDDKAWSLTEEDMVAADGKSVRRYQTIRVLRDDRLVDFTKDMGETVKFTTEPFYIPSFGVHSAGELFEYANILRRDGTGIDTAMEQHREEQDLMGELVAHAEMVQEYIKRNPRTVAQLRERKKQLVNG